MGQESPCKGLSKRSIIRISHGIKLGKELKRTRRSKVLFYLHSYHYIYVNYITPEESKRYEGKGRN